MKQIKVTYHMKSEDLMKNINNNNNNNNSSSSSSNNNNNNDNETGGHCT